MSEKTDLGDVTANDIVRTLIIKDSATPDGLASALLSNPDRVRPVLDRGVADGLIESVANTFRLTWNGKTIGRALMAADRRRWGTDNAVAALDAFQHLDCRMKETVTAWQLRDVSGTQVLNDHTDAGYDTSVLGRLSGLHNDAAAWLSTLSSVLGIFGRYRARLERALKSVLEGDQRFLASPRVDSYHSVWFELHEDLILLAGRTRADETAAGRA